jgi:hypothetical protein
MLECLLLLFQAMEKRKSEGGSKGLSGLLSRVDIHNAISMFFPAKSEAAMNAIKRALMDDQSGEPIDYNKLFEEDEDMNQVRSRLFYIKY